MIPEKYKLILLGSLLLACMSTIFTTTSFDAERLNLPDRLSVPLHIVCGKIISRAEVCKKKEKKASRKPMDQLTEVIDENEDSCRDMQDDVLDCIAAANSAYRQINMGTCLSKIRSYQFCRAEWCEEGDRDSSDDKRRNLGVSSKDRVNGGASSGDEHRNHLTSKDVSVAVGEMRGESLCHQKCHALKESLQQCESGVVQKELKRWDLDRTSLLSTTG